MNYTHLIHQYLEGRLEGHLEEMLFAELGRNSLLRRELSAQIKLGSAARRDAVSIVPSEYEKQSIFAELGFATSGTSSQLASISASVPMRLVPSFASTLVMLLGALALSVGLRSDHLWLPLAQENTASQIRFRLRLPTFDEARVFSAIRTQHFAWSKHPPTEHIENDTLLGSTDLASHSLLLPTVVSALPDDAHSLREPNFSGQFSEEIPADLSNAINSSPNASPPSSSVLVLTKAAPLPKHSQAAKQRITDKDPFAEPLPVRLGVRQALGAGAVGIHGMVQYAITQQHTIGFEGGSESAQLFRVASRGAEGQRMGDGGAETLFSGTAFYRYTFTGWGLKNVIVPFVQGGFGVVGKCGAVQGMGGLRFDVLPELSFTLAAEVKMPVLYETNYFQTKTGLSIGLQYHLSSK